MAPLNKLKLFVSIPMAGKSEEEIRDCFTNAYQEVFTHYQDMANFSLVLLDSFFQENLSPLECLGKSLMLMSQADIVYFSKGWEKSRGCMIEHHAASLYNKTIVYEGHI